MTFNQEPERSSQPSGETAQWAIVLAGGEGTRLAPVTRLLYGCEVPKQFAFLDGDRSLLQQTMERVGQTVPPERTVVVVAANRRQMAGNQLGRYRGVQIISQPANVGTGPGVLLPLSLIKAQSPKAAVMITPSDHYVPELAQFLAATRLATATVRYSPSGLVVLGAEADRPDTDLGWILPEDPSVTSEVEVGMVDVFVEKPPLTEARDLFQRGGLWNTMVVFGTVQSLWRQSGRYLPDQVSRFDRFVDALAMSHGRPDESAHRLLAQLYRSMPKADFSRSILQQVRGTAVVTLKRSGWCDCGTPARLLGCLGESVGQGRIDVLKAALHSLIPAVS